MTSLPAGSGGGGGYVRETGREKATRVTSLPAGGGGGGGVRQMPTGREKATRVTSLPAGDGEERGGGGTS